MENRAAKIVALKRYLSLLRQEEARLAWVMNIGTASAQERAEAEAALGENSRKLINADKELRGLEGGRR